jgi:hypothetical protein
MASSGKKKTTMAKLSRESRLRERRLDKQARKNARKLAAANGLGDSAAGVDEVTDGEGTPGEESPGEATLAEESSGEATPAEAQSGATAADD